jgi:peptidoglycan/LPS O-acetylase OafA/YrhL
MLLRGMALPQFLARRFFRVLPLAWVYLVVALSVERATIEQWLGHLLFYANLMPLGNLLPTTEHMWSLCVEMQFYVGIALLVGLAGRRGLWLLPVMAAGFTALRVWDSQLVASGITYYRIDEILAGGMLALAHHHTKDGAWPRWMTSFPLWLAGFLFVGSCLDVGWMPYLRPYAAALLVGLTLARPETWLSAFLSRRQWWYLATISYALYVIHPLLSHSWLGSGDRLEKYLKRPLLFAVLFALAHVSTFRFERYWIALGRRLFSSPPTPVK